jgi:menaquinone-dependent protoporphyrinogen oxidase
LPRPDEGLRDLVLRTFDSLFGVSGTAQWDWKLRRLSNMTKILISYGTTEGHTARIAEFIADAIRGRGHDAEALDLKRAQAGLLDGYDAVILGGSIHMGKHGEYLRDFVLKNRDALERLPSAFFSVSLAAHGDLANAQAYVENFEQETGWRPAQIGLFGGALPYRKYGFFKRLMMKKIVSSKPGNLSTDTSRDHEYTDWQQVRGFAEDFLQRLVPQDAAKIKS